MLQDYLIGFCKAWAEPLLQPFSTINQHVSANIQIE